MNRKWREQTIVSLTKHGVSLDDERRALRQAATLQRLAEAQCNGDWPADNGQRETKLCEHCGLAWHPSAFSKDGRCVDCRTEARSATLAAKYGAKAITQGDPRGCVLSWRFEDGKEVGIAG